jgi:hypothetical protein
LSTKDELLSLGPGKPNCSHVLKPRRCRSSCTRSVISAGRAIGGC